MPAMQIAILVFPKLTALDAIGPYEVLSRLPGFELTFVAAEAGENYGPTPAGSASPPTRPSKR